MVKQRQNKKYLVWLVVQRRDNAVRNYQNLRGLHLADKQELQQEHLAEIELVPFN